MTLKQIYKKFNTPKNLQEHMLRVAGLSKIITDNWTDPKIEQTAIIKACTLHDIAKPVAFDISIGNLSKYGLSKKDGIKLTELQKFIKAKFGEDEHKAAVGMSKDVGLNEIGLKVLDNIEWHYIPRLLAEADFNSLISIYCDMRIGPNGILTMQERISNLKERRGPKAYEYEKHRKNGQLLEQKLQENVSTDLNSITDENLNSLFPELLNLEV